MAIRYLKGFMRALLVSVGTLVLYPVIGTGHHDQEVDPEHNGAEVSLHGLPVLIE